MLLYLTRHGKTDYNARGLCQGQLDIPLNKEGREQAEILGTKCKNLPLTKIYSSELSRAYDTARAIAQYHPHLDIEVSPALKNQYWGSIQGQPNPNFPINPPDVESQAHLDARLRVWLLDLVDKHVADPDPDPSSDSADTPANGPEPVILAATHEDCITSILGILLAQNDIPSAVETEIAPGVVVTGRPSNTKLAEVEIWKEWSEGEKFVKIKARIEAWSI